MLESVKAELYHYLSHNPKPDHVTFSGSGEPTLNSGIGNILGFLKHQVPDISVAVLTNGTLLFRNDMRNELKATTVVMPSLDAATEQTFAKINRPHSKLRIENIINGLVKFRKEYSGQIWLEIL